MARVSGCHVLIRIRGSGTTAGLDDYLIGTYLLMQSSQEGMSSLGFKRDGGRWKVRYSNIPPSTIEVSTQERILIPNLGTYPEHTERNSTHKIHKEIPG